MGTGTGVLALGAALLGSLAAAVLYMGIVRQPAGTDRMVEIAEQIHIGAMTYLREQYLRIALFVAVVAILLSFQYDLMMSASFIFGGLTSAAAGFVGMKAATKANVRTTAAALYSGERAALNVSFNGGAVMGLTVASFGLFGLGILFMLFGNAEHVNIIWGFAMGASSIALFARVGGGIFTKAADVGADLVGKLEANIPEDDPRNPAVIADNVGDNVGDVAGMGADIYESYVDAVVAAVAIAATSVLGGSPTPGARQRRLAAAGLAAAGLVASSIGIFSMRLLKVGRAPVTMRLQLLGAVLFLFIAVLVGMLIERRIRMGPFFSVMAGTVAGVVIGRSTEHYTDRPDGAGNRRRLAHRARHQPDRRPGRGLRSTAIPILVVLSPSWRFSKRRPLRHRAGRGGHASAPWASS